MRVYTALPVPARRRSGRPLNASSLGRGQSGLIFPVRLPSRPSADRRGIPLIGPTVRGPFVRFGSAASPPPGVVAAPSAAVSLAAPARPPSRWHSSPLSASRPNQALQRTGSVRGFTLLSPVPARRRSGRPLNASSLGRTNRAVGGSLSRCSWGFTRWLLLTFLAALLAAVDVAASTSLPSRSCSQQLRQSAACGLTRRCSGPAVCAGLHCSPGSSPSSIWPAAERFFVRPRSKRSVASWVLAVLLVRGPSRVPAHRPHGPRRGRPLRVHRVSSPGRRRRSFRCGLPHGSGSSVIPSTLLAVLRVAA